MFLRNHFQNAFITHDVREAMAGVDRCLGRNDWIRFEPHLMLKTPSGPRSLSTRAAIAWRDGLQLELIEPVSGFVEPFRAVLPESKSDPTPRFHHIAVRRDDETAMRREIQELGLPILFEGSLESVTFIYVDTRAALGHYLEYTYMPPENWAKRGWPKDKVVVP